jgi:RHS repeat-associated protein
VLTAVEYKKGAGWLGLKNGRSRRVSGSISRFLPFGDYRTTPATNPGTTDRGFTGHRHNDELELIYMNARYFLPGTGRFISADTIVPDPANPQSHNRYSYVRNNALNYIDPSGHAETSCIEGVETCATDVDDCVPQCNPGQNNWADGFIQYLLENTDLNDSSDNPLGQFILDFYLDTMEGWNSVMGSLTPEDALLDAIYSSYKYVADSGLTPYDALEKHRSLGLIFDLGFFLAMNSWVNNIRAHEAIFISNYLEFPFGARNPDLIVYTSKVQGQMQLDDIQGFPRTVDNYLPNYGRATRFTSGDGIVRTRVVIPGYYQGHEGAFTYIFEPDGLTVNHRMFHSYPLP